MPRREICTVKRTKKGRKAMSEVKKRKEEEQKWTKRSRKKWKK